MPALRLMIATMTPVDEQHSSGTHRVVWQDGPVGEAKAEAEAEAEAESRSAGCRWYEDQIVLQRSIALALQCTQGTAQPAVE